VVTVYLVPAAYMWFHSGEQKREEMAA